MKYFLVQHSVIVFLSKILEVTDATHFSVHGGLQMIETRANSYRSHATLSSTEKLSCCTGIYNLITTKGFSTMFNFYLQVIIRYRRCCHPSAKMGVVDHLGHYVIHSQKVYSAHDNSVLSFLMNSCFFWSLPLKYCAFSSYLQLFRLQTNVKLKPFCILMTSGHSLLKQY